MHSVGAAPGSHWGSVEKRSLGEFSGCKVLRVLRFIKDGLLAALTYWHVVFLLEVGRIYLVVVEYESLVFALLLRCIVDRVVPFEGESLDRESVSYHSRQQLVVDDIAQHVAVSLHDVLEDFEVSLRL